MPAAVRRGSTALAVTVAVGAFAACGGDDGAGNEDFVQQANAICERHTERIEAATSEALAGGELPDPREFGRLAQQTIIPEISMQVEELRALEPPDEIAEDFEQFVGSADDARQRLQENPALLTDASNFEDVNRQADELGLSQSCRIGPD